MASISFLNFAACLQVLEVLLVSHIQAAPVDSSAYSPNASTYPPSPKAIQLQASLASAISRKERSFEILAAEYYFGSSGFLIEQAEHMEITVSPGTTFWFAIGGGVRFERCTNVSFRGNGVKIDYNPPPFIQVTAIENSTIVNNNVQVKVSTDHGYIDPDVFWNMYSSDPTNEFVQGPQWWSGANGTAYPLVSQQFMGFNADKQISKTGNAGEFVFIVGAVKKTPFVPAAGDKIDPESVHLAGAQLVSNFFRKRHALFKQLYGNHRV
eukprot:m.1178309 g.1178309  ORF g.1178309 m.1178309 type:complete len:267 (+) comp24526_c0_seq2:191-991(+)